jgi:hypothetical protein
MTTRLAISLDHADTMRGSKRALADDGGDPKIPAKCYSRGCTSKAKYIAVEDYDDVTVPPEFSSLPTLCGTLWDQVCYVDIARLAVLRAKL